MATKTLFVGVDEDGDADYGAVYRLEDVRVLRVESRMWAAEVQERLVVRLDGGGVVPVSRWLDEDDAQKAQEAFLRAWTGRAPYDGVLAPE